MSAAAPSPSLLEGWRGYEWRCPSCSSFSLHNQHTCTNNACACSDKQRPFPLYHVFPALPPSAFSSSSSSSSSPSPCIPPVFFHLIHLPAMDKQRMSGRCHAETSRMEQFMQTQFGMRNVTGEWFVDGVRAFTLDQPLNTKKDHDVITFRETPDDEDDDKDEGGFMGMFGMRTKKKQQQKQSATPTEWSMTAAELRSWQQSFRLYALSSFYSKSHSLSMLRDTMSGRSGKGEAAFGMKFVVRAAQTPIVCDFDGVVVPRSANTPEAGRIWLLSVTGIDFAGRHHDEADIKAYVKNWASVFALSPNDPTEIAFPNGRDFVYLRNAPLDMDWDRLDRDLLDMVRMRLFTADCVGVQVVIETGIGLGVFSGDQFGIGAEVRGRSARALKRVLEEEHTKLTNVLCVVLALPIFRRGDNYFYFEEAFADYQGPVPVLLVDQDMHKLARTSAACGFITSELNPADSHGVFGEYWQNRGPGTEEKLALTTLGLMTQHHAVNSLVVDTTRYHLLDPVAYGKQKAASSKKSTDVSHAT